MKLLLSGEGPTDLGMCGPASGYCSGTDFTPGPMAHLLLRLLEPLLGYSLADFPDSLAYISETALHDKTKNAPARLQPMRGKKRGAETGYFYGNAMTLGRLAIQLAQEEAVPVLAVFFRDTDGTASSAATLWEDKWRSIHDGFAAAGFVFGVPMLPKPKSEAWLLCVAGGNPGGSCASLEELPGNDDAPRSAKSQLADRLGHDHSAAELCDWLGQQPLDAPDVARLQSMPSFQAFYQALEVATLRLLGRTPPPA